MWKRGHQPLEYTPEIIHNSGNNHVIPQHNITTRTIVHLVAIDDASNFDAIILGPALSEKFDNMSIFVFEDVNICELV